jgi:hypothetical protein
MQSTKKFPAHRCHRTSVIPERAQLAVLRKLLFCFMLADLTVGLISVLTDVIWRITVVWHAGNFACKFIRFLQVCTIM